MELTLRNNYKLNLQNMNRDEIKYISIIAMFIGHLFLFLLPDLKITLFFNALSQITKISMVFFLVEGYFKTRSKKDYAMRLFMIGVFTEPIYIKLTQIYQLNMLFTLLTCLLMMALIEDTSLDIVQKTLWWLILIAGTDYCEGTMFSLPAMSVFLYFAYRKRKKKMKITTAFFWGFITNMLFTFGTLTYMIFWQNNLEVKESITHMLAFTFEILWVYFILYGAYNGRKSSKNVVFNKWFFYLFYPMQFVFIYMLRELKYLIMNFF